MTEPDYYGEKPQLRDLGEHFESLAAWVSHRMPPYEQAKLIKIEATPASANGFAGESFITEIAFRETADRWHTKRFLLKRKPTRHVYFPEHDFEAEFRVQEALFKNGRVPIAPVAAYESDPAVLGAPFYLLGFVTGRPTPDRPSYHHDGWLVELEPQDQRAVCVSGLEALAKLHSMDLDRIDAGFLRRTTSAATQLDWDLGLWDRFSAVSWQDEPIRIAQDCRKWLQLHKPASKALGISWGDARPGNMLFDGTKCVAVIDWDMVSAGVPEKDLGYWLAMDLQFQRIAEQLGGGKSRLIGWPNQNAMIDIYEKAAGKPIDRSTLRYYRIFAAFQIACMYSRYVTMRKDLDNSAKSAFLSDEAPPLAGLAQEMAAAD